MRNILILLLGAVAIGALSYFCFLEKSKLIESDLISKAKSAYIDKNMDWVKTDISGSDLEMTRVLTLKGTTTTQELKDRAEKIALSIDGVDGVDNQIVVSKPPKVIVVKKSPPPIKVTPPPAPKVVSPYIITIKRDSDSKILLTGYVPDRSSHDELLEHIYSLFDKERVVDNLKESGSAPDGWIESAKLSISNLNSVDYGEFKMVEYNLTFKGYTDSIDNRELILQSFKDNLKNSYSGEYTIDVPKNIERRHICQKEFKEILSSNKIHFKYNSADLKKSSSKLLDQLASIIKKCPDEVISIEGHTDSDGSKSYNLKLSNSRAKSVKEYLINIGISKDRLEAIGYGESKPIASNKTRDGKAENRRIEFKIKGVE